MAERRRLPVIQREPAPAPPAAGEDARPRWHWVGFGTVAIFSIWLLPPASRRSRPRVAALELGPHALALALAAFAGGFLVGRFGEGAGPLEAAAAGAATALLATVLVWSEAGVSWASLVALVIAVAFSAGGGRLGAARRASSRAS